MLIPRTVRPAAIGLIIIMIGALVMHATKKPGGIAGGTFAGALLLGLIVMALLRRPAHVLGRVLKNAHEVKSVVSLFLR